MGQDLQKVDRHIGQKLRQRREASGLTREELGEKIGISAAQVRLFEDGEKRIPPRRLIEAAELFKVSIDTFFQGAPETVSSPEVANISSDVMRFLSMPEAFALVSAFVALPHSSQRQAVVEYARTARNPSAMSQRY